MAQIVAEWTIYINWELAVLFNSVVFVNATP
jgi:hypothetical protein